MSIHNTSHTAGGTLGKPPESGSSPAKTHRQKVRVLKSLVENQGTAAHGEHQLLLKLVQAPQHISRLSKFPYLKDFEWFLSPNRQDLGRGDAMFVDKTGGKVLILELKTLHMGSSKTARTARNAARKKAKQQAAYYAAHYKRMHPQFQVFAGTCCEQLSVSLQKGDTYPQVSIL
ncbi:hypothetical protein CEUSTIGMA_g5677.t1 [Chlamydomonas eustigma]|uniref:Uncharacterized protein n=1 Tax=Chlamydomonas eustigma TaxID=1157962 RepID=A0A250X579_9CHLO|nr:hypothetical protein CEUSTIGMA_g5677.t1 [Chlamydomonas eustigma]|eukprot:GAX78235.1 hypothetical protein CEUSTIGMA_g5677.t1 [Chlamydomonas eustigma]